MSFFELVKKIKDEWPMIRLYKWNFWSVVVLVGVTCSCISWKVAKWDDEKKIEAANLDRARAEAKQDLGGVSDRLLKEDALSKVRLLRALYHFIDDKKEGREIATDTRTNYISTRDRELFEEECRVKCKALRDALMGRIGERGNNEAGAKYYNAPFGPEMLKAIADDLERLATLLRI